MGALRSPVCFLHLNFLVAALPAEWLMAPEGWQRYTEEFWEALERERLADWIVVPAVCGWKLGDDKLSKELGESWQGWEDFSMVLSLAGYVPGRGAQHLVIFRESWLRLESLEENSLPWLQASMLSGGGATGPCRRNLCRRPRLRVADSRPGVVGSL